MKWKWKRLRNNLENCVIWLCNTELYVELYEWYYLPSSVYKILIHGLDIIQNAAFPIGMVPEEWYLSLETKILDLFALYTLEKF